MITTKFLQRCAAGLLLLGIFFMAGEARADTIYLKDGTVLKCKGTAYREGRFTISLGTNSASQATIAVGDVDRIEFESGAGPQAITIYMKDGTALKGRGANYRDSQFTMMIGQAASRAIVDIADVQRIEMEAGSQIRSEGAAVQPPPVIREETPNLKAVATDTSSTRRQGDQPGKETSRPRTSAGEMIKTTNVGVAGKSDWTSTGVLLKRGDRVKITASGMITIDPASNRRTGPEGVEMADSNKLMPGKPTGALIAVIGTDNDEFVFIGKSGEFTATRDGLLFLSINEGNLADNLGAFSASIVVQPSVNGVAER